MQRRDFISCAAVGSVCALAPVAVAQAGAKKKSQTENSCKITVLKKTINSDLYQQYRNTQGKPCTVFEEGQEFEVKSPYKPPEGFCDWAWADIRHFILAVYFGREDTVVACCTDGFRPVLFKIERIA